MTRRLILFLALLLPLQFAWASAAAYCQHEANPSQSRHVGHHEHLHEAGVEKAPSPLAADDDCATCHTAAAPVILDASVLEMPAPTTAAVVPHVLRRVPTALASAPDRPQWLRLA